MKEWGVKPHEWPTMPRWSRAIMVAFDETEAKFEWWRVEDARVKT